MRLGAYAIARAGERTRGEKRGEGGGRGGGSLENFFFFFFFLPPKKQPQFEHTKSETNSPASVISDSGVATGYFESQCCANVPVTALLLTQ